MDAEPPAVIRTMKHKKPERGHKKKMDASSFNNWANIDETAQEALTGQLMDILAAYQAAVGVSASIDLAVGICSGLEPEGRLYAMVQIAGDPQNPGEGG